MPKPWEKYSSGDVESQPVKPWQKRSAMSYEERSNNPAMGALAYKPPEIVTKEKAAKEAMIGGMSEADKARYKELENQPAIGAGLLDFLLPDAFTPDFAKAAPIGKFPMGAMRTKDKLVAGFGDLLDYTTAVGADILPGGSQKLRNEAIQRIVSRSREQKTQDKFFQGFDENPGISGHLGGMVPYVLLERLAGPITKKISSGITTPMQKALEATTEEGRSILKGLNTPIDPIHPLETLKTALANIKNVPPRPIPISDPYLAGRLDDIMGGTILGAAEGGLHYDNSTSDGAIAGLVGGMSGNAIRNSLIHAPNYNSPPVNDILQRFKDKYRYRLTPGLELGDKGLQEFEQAMRSSRHWANIIGAHDRANSIAINKMTARAMGLPDAGDVVDLSPKVLAEHRNYLGNEFNNLENNTKLAFDNSDMRQIAGVKNKAAADLNDLSGNSRKPNRDALKAANYYSKQINNASVRVNDPTTGKFSHRKMSGPDYKRISSELKAELDAAKETNNTIMRDTLQPIQNAFNRAVDNGITKYQGSEGLAKWNDIREKYAMTKMVMDNGMIGLNHDVNPRKIASYFEQNEPARVLMDSASGRVKDLHELARLNTIERTQKRSTLSGLDMDISSLENPLGNFGGRQSLFQKFLSSPVVRDLPILPKAYLAMYMRGYPVKTGLLNMSGQGFGNPAAYTRAFAQDTQLAPKLAHAVGNAASSASDKYDSFKQYMEDYLMGNLQ